MPGYRYLFADGLTGQILEELPVTCQNYSQQINGVGTLTGTIALGDLDPALGWKSATANRRALLVVQRDDQYQWGGLVMKTRPVNGSTAAEITAETLEGYWGRRRIKTDLTETGADLFTIVRDIITQMQAVTGGNLRMAVTAGSHGTSTTVTYLGKDRVKALDAITRLADVSPFEFTITWARSGTVLTPTLVLAAPALNAATDAVLLEYPGVLAAPVEDPADGGDAPNALTGVGADSGGTPLLAEVIGNDEITAGYPIFEDELSATDETDYTRLLARTTTALNAKLNDHSVPTVQLRPPTVPEDLQFGDFPLGAPVRLRCTCPYHPATVGGAPGLDTTGRRVTGWTVVPGPAEQVTLALGGTVGKITLPRDRQTDARRITAYLQSLAQRLLTIETSR